MDADRRSLLCLAGVAAVAAALTLSSRNAVSAATAPVVYHDGDTITLVRGLVGRVVGSRLVVTRAAIARFRRANQRKEVIVRAPVPGYPYAESPYIQITASALAVAPSGPGDLYRDSVSVGLHRRADGLSVLVAHEETLVWVPGRRRFVRHDVRDHRFLVRDRSRLAAGSGTRPARSFS